MNPFGMKLMLMMMYNDTINTHISHIRKKIKAITNEDYIQTIWGIGYKIK